MTIRFKYLPSSVNQIMETNHYNHMYLTSLQIDKLQKIYDKRKNNYIAVNNIYTKDNRVVMFTNWNKDRISVYCVDITKLLK